MPPPSFDFTVRGIIPVIDPYKTSLDDVCEKVKMADDQNVPFLLVASTDREKLNDIAPPIIKKIAAFTRVKVYTHFLPTPGEGFTLFSSTSGAFLTSVINSRSPYYNWRDHTGAYFETSIRHDTSTCLRIAGIALGPDRKTSLLADTVEIGMDKRGARWISEQVEDSGDFFRFVYVYCRGKKMCARFVGELRNRLPHALGIFASGNIRTANHASELLNAGATFVAAGGAFEGECWKTTAAEIFKCN